MTEITPFTYQGIALRTIEQNGEPWFVASDVAKVLAYRNAPDMTRRLDDDDKGYAKVRTPGGDQELTIINESGLYDAIFRSNAVGAKPFRRWVTSDVLPSIRKHGAYLTEQTAEQILADPDTIIQLATQVKTERAQRVQAEKAREAMSSYAKELEPKADAYDAFLDADGVLSVANVAKILGVSQNKLFDLMRNAGILIAKGHQRNTPYQQYMHHFRVIPYTIHHNSGEEHVSYTTKVQPSGVEFIRRKLGLTHAAA
jgi:anti-repressor protein